MSWKLVRSRAARKDRAEDNGPFAIQTPWLTIFRAFKFSHAWNVFCNVFFLAFHKFPARSKCSCSQRQVRQLGLPRHRLLGKKCGLGAQMAHVGRASTDVLLGCGQLPEKLPDRHGTVVAKQPIDLPASKSRDEA